MAVSPSMQKSQGTGAVVEDGICNCRSITLVGSNGLLFFTHSPCAASENRTVCRPAVLIGKKNALSGLFWVGNATRTEVDGMVGPESCKQKPFTLCAAVSYGLCGGPSLSSSA